MEQVGKVSVSKYGTRTAKLRAIIILTISLLIIQFVIGMAVNLFAVFPSTSSGNSPDQALVEGIVQTGPGLVVHVLNGLVILALSGAAIYFSIKTTINKVVTLAVLGFAFVLLALIGGVTFGLSGFQNNFDSFLMALGFILAISSYFLEWNSWSHDQIGPTSGRENSVGK